MRAFASKIQRIGPGAYQAVACVVLFASVGFAAGASRPSSRAAAARSVAEPAPRQEVYGLPSASPSCAERPADETMLLVPAGTYRSFFKRGGKTLDTPVPAFLLDERPVDRVAFAAFVAENPVWRRSRVKRILAEEAYLTDFKSDTEPGGAGSSPVTFVSWFAARAYCACQGKRLPTLSEWERAASPASDAETGDAPPLGRNERLAFAMGGAGRSAGRPKFGSVWEWTEDFDGAPVSGRTSDAADSNLFCGAGVRAADATDYGGFLRYSFRSSLRAAYALKNLGFRCARDAR